MLSCGSSGRSSDRAVILGSVQKFGGTLKAIDTKGRETDRVGREEEKTGT